ncbi:hypothetical protein Pst134EA_019214 [Puccinia striiformis f. sp. tritici]|uniref:hypothetical protein n=1 Tax=Puccinia striiformis f. sp. tritici TaxID=168172 RepID=UPI00200875A7|nr:hypothetical protein Pst134EA_019214 [Puccinia striiformis f. sp. tritici]KAH9459063.1 hypothetical protein Pst134EA_019214 [Puccinia striiformis f. sp. tritici]
MLCILCGQSPIKVGGICQACINAAATKTPAITPQILHPANPLIVSRDEKQNKRQEAVARATQLYNPAVGNPSTVIPLNQSQLSFGGRPFRAIASAAISTSSSVPQNLDSIPQIIGPAYDSARTARVASFDPYPTSQASRASAKRSKAPAHPKPPANKGALPAINPPVEIAMPCGFEMWSNGGWTPKQKVRPVVHYVKWALADAYTELKRELCDKFCGKVELVTRPNEDREIFTADHFPYCHLGNRKGGSVEDNKSFVDFLKREKTIDLIFDRDAFQREDLDRQEEEACTNQARSYALRSGITPQDTNTRASPDSDISIVSSLPSAGAITESAIAASTITGESTTTRESTTSKSQIESHTTKVKIPTPENIPRAQTTRSTNAEGAIPPMDLTNLLGEDQLVFVKITPPCKQSFYFMFPKKAAHTSERMDDSGWVDGVRYELNPDGLSMTQRICLYKVDYKKCLKLKESTKVISAEIYDSGKVFPMVAEYSRTKIDVMEDSGLTEVALWMRTRALARQMMAQFKEAIQANQCGGGMKQFARRLSQIIDAFAVHYDISTRPRSGDKLMPGQDDDMLEVTRMDTPDGYTSVRPLEPEKEPSRVFLMEEVIHGMTSLLSPDDPFYHLTDNSPPIDLFLHSLQHWVYSLTQGQMTLTHFKGHPPLLSKGQIIDLNPDSASPKAARDSLDDL